MVMALRFESFVNLTNRDKYNITHAFDAARKGSNDGFVVAYRNAIPGKRSALLQFDVDTWKEAMTFIEDKFKDNFRSLRELLISQVGGIYI